MNEMDKVIGYESIKKELNKIIDIFHNPARYKALGVNLPKGVMFEGVPGIGKTLMAKAFISESGRKSFIIRKDHSNGEFVNLIRETFKKAAEEAPSILLLDDLDKFANEDHFHRDAEEYVTVQACIDEYKNVDLFIVATCNDIRSLPDSLVRVGRFDKTFHMSFPKDEDAKKIIAFYLKDKVVADDIDVDEIARFSEGNSCAALESVVNEAGVLAGYENKTVINQEDFRKACLNVFWGIDGNNDSDEETIRRKAVHEAGHATLIECLCPGEVSLISVEASIYRGDAVVVRKNKEHRFADFGNVEIAIMTKLAGKAATEILLGEVDMGANDDLRGAYELTARLLDNVASYDFQSWLHGPETSQRVREHLDDAKGTEVARYYLKTKQILMQNRAFLEALIKEVIEKKTITYKEIAPLREKYLTEKNVA